MSCPVSEIKDVIEHSGQAPVTIQRLNEFLDGVVDGIYAIAQLGGCTWSKGVDDYSTGMNTVSSWYSGLANLRGVQDDEPAINAEGAISILNHIRYVSKNLIKDNGMKTIHELAAVGIGYLGRDPYEQSNS